MIEAVMVCGVGLLAGSLFALLLVPFVHARAVRLTTRALVETIPVAALEIRAEKDQMRAQFAVALRQLEVNMDELKAKSAMHFAELGRKTAEVTFLRAELDKSTRLLLALQTRDRLHGALIKRIVRVVLYLLTRKERHEARALAETRGAKPGIVRAA